MKKFYQLICLLIFALPLFSVGQTTIAVQDFETVPATPTLTFTNTNGAVSTGTNGAGGIPANANLFAGGVRGWQVVNATSTLTFANQSLAGYTNAAYNFRLAGMSGNNSNGIDVLDVVTVLISVDGGTSYSSELTIAGSAANQRWDFTAIGNASVTYDGNNTPTGVTSASGSAGISTVSLNIPNGFTQVRIRIVMLNNDANERWVMDDVKLTGCLTPGTPSSTTPTAICAGSTTSITGAAASGTVTGYTFWTASSGGSAVTTLTTPPGSVSGNTLTTLNSQTSSATYYVQAENGAGCSSAARQAVTVTINPVGSFTPSSPAVCTGSTASLTTSTAGTFSSVLPADATITGSGTAFNINAGTTTGAGSATFTATTGGCTSTLNYTIVITPTEPVAATPASVCQGTSAIITGAGSTGATTYTYWDAPSGGTKITAGVSGGNLTTSTSLAGGTYNYYVQGENATCVSATRQLITVTVIAAPANPANPTAAANPSCGATFLNTMTVPGGVNYYWQGTNNFGISNAAGVDAATNTFPVSSSNTYYVRAYDGVCWSPGSGSLAVVVNTAPAITLDPASPASSCFTYTGSLSVTATGTSLVYTWQSSVDNGSSGWTTVANNTPAGATYTTGGGGTILNINTLTQTYYYRVVVSNAGCTAVPSSSATVTVTPAITNFSGSYNVPATCFPTLASFVSALNAGVVTGAVTVNVAAGHTETVPVGGITITQTGTAAFPIVFQKSGVGTNPTFTAGLQVAGSNTDAIFKIVGADYITLNGFNLQENAGNAVTATGATNTMTEWGIGLFYATNSNGAQNNTIQNCSISLNRAYANSFGIYSNTKHTASSLSIADAIAGGMNSNNKIYNNSISNVNNPVSFVGVSGSTLHDTGNDIGGTSTATTNTISNWGSNSPNSTIFPSVSVTVFGIYMNHQDAYKVSYNTLTSATGIIATTLAGIRTDYSNGIPAGTFANTIAGNTITLNSASTSNSNEMRAINSLNSVGGEASAVTMDITGNLILNCAITGASSSAAFTGIANSFACGILNMNGNTFRGFTSTATSGLGVTGFSNSGAVATNININGNFFGDASGDACTFSAASSSQLKAIENSGSKSGASILSIQNNDIRRIVHTGTCSGEQRYIGNNSGNSFASINMSGNTFTNITANVSSPLMSFLYTTSTVTDTKTVNNNAIVGSYTKSAAGGTITFYSDITSGSQTTITHTNTGNNFSNINISSGTSTTINGWWNTDAGTKTIQNNTFNNITGAGTVTWVMNIASSTLAASDISGNTITNITAANSITGLSVGLGTNKVYSNPVNTLSSSGGSVTGIDIQNATTNGIYLNTVHTLSTNGPSAVTTAIKVSGGTTINIYKNKVYNINALNESGNACGVNVAAGTTVNLYNNTIGDIKAPSAKNASAVTAVIGINISSTTANSTINVFYNTVNLNITTPGNPNFGSSGIFHTVNATATTATLNLRNNIIVNTSTFGSGGLTVAYRRSGTALNNYAGTSNNNLFYAGTPGASRLIFYDGTNADQTLLAYQSRVSTIDAASVTEDLSSKWVSTTGSSNAFLHISNAATSQVESGAVNISTYTDDYDGHIRFGNAGYPGGNIAVFPAPTGGIAPDIGADEISAVAPVIVTLNSVAINPTGNQCTAVARTITANTTAGSTNIVSVTLNYSFNGTAQTAITMTGGTFTGTSNWTGSIPVPSPVTATVAWSVTVTDGFATRILNGTGYTDEPLNGATATATVSASSVCLGSPVTLNVLLQKAGNSTIGAGVSSASGYSNPFYSNWANNKLQILYLATELQAAGFSAGNITGLGLTVTSGTTPARQNFTINIGATAANALIATLLTPTFTTVFSAGSYTPVIGLNSFNISATPFLWDGTSNVVIQFCWDNTASTATVSNTVLADNTVFNSCVSFNRTSITGTSTCSISTPTGNNGPLTLRPQIIFTANRASAPTGYSWSDGSTTVGTTNPLTISPTSTKTYTAIVTSSGCTINSNGVSVAVDNIPATPTFTTATATNNNQTPCAGTAGLTYTVNAVAGATTYTWAVPVGWTVSAGAGTTSITVTAGGSSGNITVTPSNACAGTNSATLAITTGAVPAVPVASAATVITNNGFIANWGAVFGATGYLVDIMTDDFADNNFNANPVWSGDAGSYGMQTATPLPNGTATTDLSYVGSTSLATLSALYTPSTEAGEWKFSLGSTNYSPSSVNFFGVVLMSDATFSGDITIANFNGYYLRIGNNGSPDQIELWRSTGTTKFRIGAFPFSPDFNATALTDGLNIRVTRTAAGLFELFYSTGFTYASIPATSAGTLSDATFSTSAYFGIYTNFNTTAATKRVYIDNITLGYGYLNEPSADIFFEATGLATNRTYNYVVRATNACGTSANSNSISVLTVTPCVPTAVITSFAPASGPSGTLVTITGTGFSGVTAVKFGTLAATTFTVVSSTKIIAEVPPGAITEKIYLTDAVPCTAVSVADFTVISQTASCGTNGSTSTVNDISISEVYDAKSGSLSYIEIFNGTLNPVILGSPNNYVVRIITGTNTINDVALTGTLASGAVYIVSVGTSASSCSNFTANISLPGASGFDGNDRIYLRKNGADIDYVPNPNYGGATAPGFSQARKAVTTAANIPSTAYTAADWTITNTESCTNLGVPPYTVGGTSVTVTTPPVDENDCSAISFSVIATSNPSPPGTYLWKYYNTVTNSWDNASNITNAAIGISANGTNTATMTITGFTAQILDYQFYCEVTKNSCTVATNAVQYTYPTRPYYRSVSTGNWSSPLTWQMSNSATNWTAAVAPCQYPVKENSSGVFIESPHTVTQDIDINIDYLEVKPGGTLTTALNSQLIVSDSTVGADFIVNGTWNYDANRTNSYAPEINTGRWQLGANASIIKTNNGSSSNLRDYYQGGMTSIPANANWIIRHTGVSTDVSFTTISGTFYPNLSFESTSGAWSPTLFPASKFTGFLDFATVKGNLDIGGTGTGTVTVFNENTNAQPMLINGNMIVRTGNTLTTAGNANGTGFEVKGNLTVDGTLTVLSNNIGSLRFSGTGTQTIAGISGGILNLQDVAINNTTAAANLIVNKNFGLPGVLSFGSAAAKLSLNTGYINLQSTASKTASVAQVPAGVQVLYPGVGRFVIERYYPPKRSWRCITAPITGDNAKSVFNSWQGGGGAFATGAVGNATYVTGPAPSVANGLDASPQNNFSLYTYDQAANKFAGITDTKAMLLSRTTGAAGVPDNKGFFMFVRGDRSALNPQAYSPSGAVVATTLRDTGKIQIQSYTFPANNTAGKFTFIGNPYASPVDFSLLQKNNLNNKFWAWDPNINAVGGYVIVDLALNQITTVPANLVTSQDKYIQSQQAFFVQTTATGGASLVFDENKKSAPSTNQPNLFRPGKNNVGSLSANLYAINTDGSTKIADGLLLQYDPRFQDSLDVLDALKFGNINEMLGIFSNNKLLMLERKTAPKKGDSIMLRLSKTVSKKYRFNFSLDKIGTHNLAAFLEDNYLKTSTALNIAGDTPVDFEINTDASSKAVDRFKIVFKKAIHFINVKADGIQKDIRLNWMVEEPTYVSRYEIERSADSTHFMLVQSLLSAQEKARPISNWIDKELSPGIYYYRVKAITNYGTYAYSDVVKIKLMNSGRAVYVFPNPVTNNIINVQLNQMPAGLYSAKLSNAHGQVLSITPLMHAGGNAAFAVQPEKKLLPGAYFIEILQPDKKQKRIEVLVQ